MLAQDTHGTALMLLASSAGVLGGISAVTGYFSVHRPRTAPSALGSTDHEATYVPPPNIPAPSRYFTGRRAELAFVEGALRPPRDRDGGVRICVVHGRGGLGKTQLAATVADGRLRQQHRSLVWWLSASSYERLMGELLELAACLGIPEHNSKSVMLNRLWGRLRDAPGWLLVYDDVQEDSLGPLNEWVSDARPSLLPRAGDGAVLITTQRREGWEHLRAQSVELIALPDLNSADGRAFLRKRIEAEDDERALDELGAQLHWLPLALDQAGAYIADAEISVKEYLRRLPGHSTSSAAATFRLSIDRIVSAAPVAEDLMRLCSFLASEDVRRDMLLGHCEVIPSPLREVMEDEAEFNRVVRRLSNHSLLSRSGDSRAATVIYAMHPQVQSFVREGMDPQARLLWSQSAVQLLEAAFPRAPELLDERAACERLMPHVEAVSAELVWGADSDDHEYGAARDPQALARLLHRVGVYQEHRCDWVHALEYFEKEAALRETHPGDVLGLATAQLGVARQLYLLARLGEAEEHCRLALEQCLRRPDDPAFLPLRARCLRQLGGILRENLEFREAMAAVEQAIDIYERYGAEWEAMDRAVAEQEAGMIHRNAGRLTEALERYARAGHMIPRNGSQEPREHQVFRAMLRRDLGIVAQDRGDLEEAARELKHALDVFTAFRGTDDFETSQVAKFLGDIRRRQGEELRARSRATHRPLRRRRLRRDARARLREAAELLGPVVELHRKRRDAEAHKYAACLNKLGSLQHAQGRAAQALETLREAEAIYIAQYGRDHHYRAKTLSRLGPVLLACGDRQGAENALREAEGIIRGRLGDVHPSLVAVYERLASCSTGTQLTSEYLARAQGIQAAVGPT
ncbi:tetratricopeptide repeat protein [Streptomyces bicolor]|uniref:tetratricopeptide repeat protein n=1 Tax=Streptomyces bicolor TaxID=66874 RepID=UPI00131BEEAC|nr:tetratricopeptide repeat protein [Streptomyces bicolor]